MKMRQLLAVAVCLASVTGAALLYGAAQKDASPSKAMLEQELKATLKMRVQTAQLALEAMQAAFEAETVTLDVLMDASLKLAEAQVAVASKPEEEIAALQNCVERAKQTEANIKKLFEVGTKGGAAKDYYSAKRERESAEVAVLKAQIQAKR